MTLRKYKQAPRTFHQTHPRGMPASPWDLAIHSLGFNSSRRAVLEAGFRMGKKLLVNGKYQIQVKNDLDLQLLLKKGVIKQCRGGLGVRRGKRFPLQGKRYSYLVLA